ncbi:hypothetical protein KAT84_04955 [Candidatus Bipolaricaulota bacterium]|nr:hypothetical protein [Candidatus Bipolaricaulota bacterium]
MDVKSGVFLGLLGVFVAIAVQAEPPAQSVPWDLVATFLSFVALISAIIFLALSMRPAKKRFDPDPVKLRETCWNKTKDEVVDAVVTNLVETWRNNHTAHECKARFQQIALWLAAAGICLFALTLLVLRPFWFNL